MTKQEINKRLAKAMGLCWHEFKDDPNWMSGGNKCIHCGDECDQLDMGSNNKNYTDSIADAWTVVEWITEVPTAIIKRPNTEFMYEFQRANLWAMTSSEAAMAICLAALKALADVIAGKAEKGEG